MTLLGQAFIVMVVGMGLVFVFLAVVIQGVTLSARIIHRIEGDPQEAEDDGADPVDDGRARRRRAAAIAAALRHRRRTTHQD